MGVAMHNMKRLSLMVVLQMGLVAGGCSSAHDDSRSGLMWYRPPPKPAAKPLSPQIGVKGAGLSLDRGVPLSESSNSQDVALVTGRMGGTATIGSGRPLSESHAASWEPSAARTSRDSTVLYGVGGQISRGGSSDERTARIGTGP